MAIASQEDSGRCCQTCHKNVGQSVRQFRSGSEEQLVATWTLSLRSWRSSSRNSGGDDTDGRRSGRHNAGPSHHRRRTAIASSAGATAPPPGRTSAAAPVSARLPFLDRWVRGSARLPASVPGRRSRRIWVLWLIGRVAIFCHHGGIYQ
jgi:hypothetical protein